MLRFRILGASFSSPGCFVFEIWVRRFRDLGASCFDLRFRVLRFRNYLIYLLFVDQDECLTLLRRQVKTYTWFLICFGHASGGVLPYRRLTGMCRWTGLHFHDWIDYKGVAFSIV